MSDVARSEAVAAPTAREPKRKTARLAFLDWTRGVAALIMLQGHAFHSFLSDDLREGGTYILSQFVGGLPPAIFLFLTGVTYAFMMDGFSRKNLPTMQRITGSLRRAGYLFTLAYLFRLQLWAFYWPDAPFSNIWKVDILNCMGMSMLVLIPLALLNTHERITISAIVGLAVAIISPLLPENDPNTTPNLFRMYFVPDYRFFTFFPWASFLAFGMSMGSILRQIQEEQRDRAMQWSAILGIGLIVTAHYFVNQPYSLYPKSEFWLNSPGLILVKLGIILALIPLAFLWTEYAVPRNWSFVRQLGTTSLVVYWVHIELVYGRWFSMWKNRLSIEQTELFIVLLTLAMIALSIISSKVSWHDLRDRLRIGDAQPASS